MSLTIDKYLKFKKEYQDEITKYLTEKKAQFQKETGVEVQDIFVYMDEITALGDNESLFVISGTALKTKLSD